MQYQIKALEWNKVDEEYWVARTPSTRSTRMYIFFEEEKYWADWDLDIPGTTDLESLKRAGQDYHNRWLMQFIQTESEPWEDRMGGQFTQEEIQRAQQERW